MRHSATRSLLERRDVIIVASVSCIYGLGSPEAYYGKLVSVEIDESIEMEIIIEKLIAINYERNDYDFIEVSLKLREIHWIFSLHMRRKSRIE